MSNTTEKHTENVYAYDENFNEIFILDVPYEERGERKPYFCLGCKRKMQAVYRKKEKERHFRHVVVKLPGEKKCTYRDETYRHKLAKDIIQGLKRIKVPGVYKNHPEIKENKAILIQESHYIEGASVEIEKYIYENDNGEIVLNQSSNELDEKHLLIKPDAILMNSKREPILIIEFVATHSPDQEKLAKLKRLGINCVQMTIPKSSPEEIEQSFHETKRTKWLYNYEEDNADYFQLSQSYTGGISEVDIEQRRLSEEGFLCRKARIGSLIRSIEKILRDEHYQTIERDLKSEILRVENNTKEELTSLEGVEIEFTEREIEAGMHQFREAINTAVETGQVEGNGWFANEYRRLHEFEHAIKEYKSALEQLGRVEEKIEAKSRESRNRN